MVVYKICKVVANVVVLCGKAISADATAALLHLFQDHVEESKYLSDLIFYVDEIGLYWKKLRAQTLIEEMCSWF